MGYGGYLSLAAKFPKFVDTVTHIANEFRDIHDRTGGVAAEGELNVAILNSWGKMRSWMAFTVAHALPNKQTYSYYGILESLSGMRVNVRFISFDDVLEHGVADDIDVIVTGGPVDTAFSGGSVLGRGAAPCGDAACLGARRRRPDWRGPAERPAVPGSFLPAGRCAGCGRGASPDAVGGQVLPGRHAGALHHRRRAPGRGVLQGFLDAGYRKPLSGCGGGQAIGELGGIDFGEPIADTFPVNEDVTLLRADGGQVQLAVNEYGKGRGVYVSGLPYSAANARLLERALFWASHNEGKYAAYSSSNPECEVAVFDKSGCYCVVNNTDRAQSTYVERGDGRIERIELAPSGIAWRTI